MPAEPRLLALKTAVPPYVLDQHAVCEAFRNLFPGNDEVERLLPVFLNTAIERRYSCVPIDWYRETHGWKDRTALYVENAVNLLEGIARACLEEAGLQPSDLDMIVVASTSGVTTPSLDALLTERMQLNRHIQRLPVFGLGCAGGLLGLSRAAALARAAPKSRVLFLVVELCALLFRKNDLSKSNIVATALFGDGAAGAIVSCEGDGPVIAASGEHTWPDSLGIMGWDIEEDGLKAIFSQSIPSLVNKGLGPALDDFLRRNDLTLDDIDAFACHPGGAKVLDALTHILGGRSDLADSRAVLRDYGNMSAATVMFILERMKVRARKGRTLMTSLGPGFTAAFQVIEGR